MVEPRKLRVMLDAIAAGDLRRGMSSGRSKPSAGPGLAVIPIYGYLSHRAADSWWDMSSYEGIREDFHRAEGDSKVDAILLDIDSHGGSSAGIFDLGDEIHASKKPVYAYVNEMAYSAGYLLASSAKQVFLPRTGGVGSIGVRMVHVDQSEFNKKMGVKVTNLYVGERKVDFDPHSPLSKEAQESAMKDLSGIYDLFADAVARNRGMTVKAVKGTEAACYMGQHAVEIGLADKVMTFDEAIDFIVEDAAAGGTSRTARGAIGGKESFTMNIEREVSEMQDKAFALRGKIANMDDRLTRLEHGRVEEVSIAEARRSKEQYQREQAAEDDQWISDMQALAGDDFRKKQEIMERQREASLSPSELKKKCAEDAEDERWVAGMLALKGQKEG